MMHPSIVDGRSLVILQNHKSRFVVVATGILEHDGDTLYLVNDGASRIITDNELAGMQIVRGNSMIRACRGFDFFLIEV